MAMQKISKRNLLQHAETIGGKKMYFGMRKALRDAKMATEMELNKKQLGNVLNKLSGQEDVVIDKTKLQKLLDHQERRRQAYMKMAAESEDVEHGTYPSGLSGYTGGSQERGRYDVRKLPSLPKNVSSSVGTSAASSATKTIKNTKFQPSMGKKNIPPPAGPTTSISRVQ